jgi:hypothetical protein
MCHPNTQALSVAAAQARPSVTHARPAPPTSLTACRFVWRRGYALLIVLWEALVIARALRQFWAVGGDKAPAQGAGNPSLNSTQGQRLSAIVSGIRFFRLVPSMEPAAPRLDSASSRKKGTGGGGNGGNGGNGGGEAAGGGGEAAGGGAALVADDDAPTSRQHSSEGGGEGSCRGWPWRSWGYRGLELAHGVPLRVVHVPSLAPVCVPVSTPLCEGAQQHTPAQTTLAETSLIMPP